MHVYFSGIGGAGIGPLAVVAHQAGFTVSGSDKQSSAYLEHLKEHGIRNIHIGQEYEQIANIHARTPIDWFVYTSALPMEQPDAEELKFCAEHGIKTSKRDEFLNFLLKEKQLKLIAVAGTHGKTTTTGMVVWLCQQLNLPVSYILPAKSSFGEMGHFDPRAQYFVYEADEYDRNFLSFTPQLSLITGVDWDHADIYPTRESYIDAFREFIHKSEQAFMWDSDEAKLQLTPSGQVHALDSRDPGIDKEITLVGRVNRLDGWLAVRGLQSLGYSFDELIKHINRFPGVSRRFEPIAPNLYSDYAHTPPKIRGALQLAHEVAGDNVVVVYEGLHNTRQHFIKHELTDLFDTVKQLYIVPSYLAREDQTLPLLRPEDLKGLLSSTAQAHTEVAALDAALVAAISKHLRDGDMVLCISAGGGASLDEWLRREFKRPSRTAPH